MRFGINGTGLVQRASIDAVAEHAAAAAADGFTSYSLAEHPTGGFDALTVLDRRGPTRAGASNSPLPSSRRCRATRWCWPARR